MSEPSIINEINGKRIKQYDLKIPNQKFLTVVTNVNFATEDKINAMKVRYRYGDNSGGGVIGTLSGNCILSAIAVEKGAKVADIVYVFLSPRMGMGSLGKTIKQIKRLWKIDISPTLVMQNYVFLDIEKKDMKVFTLTELENMDGIGDVMMVAPTD